MVLGAVFARARPRYGSSVRGRRLQSRSVVGGLRLRAADRRGRAGRRRRAGRDRRSARGCRSSRPRPAGAAHLRGPAVRRRASTRARWSSFRKYTEGVPGQGKGPVPLRQADDDGFGAARRHPAAVRRARQLQRDRLGCVKPGARDHRARRQLPARRVGHPGPVHRADVHATVDDRRRTTAATCGCRPRATCRRSASATPTKAEEEQFRYNLETSTGVVPQGLSAGDTYTFTAHVARQGRGRRPRRPARLRRQRRRRPRLRAGGQPLGRRGPDLHAAGPRDRPVPQDPGHLHRRRGPQPAVHRRALDRPARELQRPRASRSRATTSSTPRCSPSSPTRSACRRAWSWAPSFPRTGWSRAPTSMPGSRCRTPTATGGRCPPRRSWSTDREPQNQPPVPAAARVGQGRAAACAGRTHRRPSATRSPTATPRKGDQRSPRRRGLALPGWLGKVADLRRPTASASLVLLLGSVVALKTRRRRRRRTRGGPATRLSAGLARPARHRA